MLLLNCKSQENIDLKNIENVYMCYQDKISLNNVYKMNGTLIKWDRNNLLVKEFLKKNESNLTNYKPIDIISLKSYLQTKKPYKYFPYKTMPLSEFGYIVTKNRKIYYYGIINNETFIDLTNNKIYR